MTSSKKKLSHDISIFLTCEHGGAKIPKKYLELFKNKKSVLKTHRALDIGALEIARLMQAQLLKTYTDIHFFYCVVSRLIIDTNRHLLSKTLLSEFTQKLSRQQKIEIIQKYYLPHWSTILKKISKVLKNRKQLIHIGIHSMTHELNGEIRDMQLALLYDPKSQFETELAKAWMTELKTEFNTSNTDKITIATNKPYKGTGDGLTQTIRQLVKPHIYCGIELEMNQKWLTDFKTDQQKKQLALKITRSLVRAINQI